MKIRYCWRCRMDVPMLDKEESKIASKLLAEGFHEAKKLMKSPLQENFKKLLDYYNELTGFWGNQSKRDHASLYRFIWS